MDNRAPIHEQRIAHTVYVRSSVQSVWEALTHPEITSSYWGGTRIESDWQVGSKILYVRDGEVTDEHTILEVNAPKLLVHTFKPLFGEFKNEKPSRVTIGLQQLDQVVRIDLVHDEFEDDSKVYPACCEGWPQIMSSLKSLLETGSPLQYGPSNA